MDTPAPKRTANAPDVTSLRSTIEWLRANGLLIETSKEVDPDLELTGLQKHLDGGPPILFENVKGKPHARAITNLFSDIEVIDQMFGFDGPVDRTRKVAWAINNPTDTVEVGQDEAPCQEHVITENIDVNEWITAIRHTDLETELTIGSGIRCVAGKYFDGGSDVGYNRMNFRWGNVGTFMISPGSHMWQVMTEHYHDEEPIPITVCFGVPPACTLLAGAGFDYVILPKGCDELAIAGTIQGEPVKLVKARTVDAWAIAESEYVLEGCIHPRDKRYETAESEKADVQGRYYFHPEWAGYMGKAYKTPTFHVSAITMRKPESKPVIFPLGVHMMDDSNIDTTVREAAIATFFETVTKAEFLDGAFRREMLGYPVSTVADIAADPQLAARGFWRDLPSPDGGSERHCGAFYRVDGGRPELSAAGGDSWRILLELGLPEAHIDALEAGRAAG